MIILRRIGPLFCSLKKAHASMNMSVGTLFNEQKDQTSWVLSHDLYWENKLNKRKRYIQPGLINLGRSKFEFEFEFDSAHVKYGVWTGPKGVFTWAELRPVWTCTSMKFFAAVYMKPGRNDTFCLINIWPTQKLFWPKTFRPGRRFVVICMRTVRGQTGTRISRLVPATGLSSLSGRSHVNA